MKFQEILSTKIEQDMKLEAILSGKTEQDMKLEAILEELKALREARNGQWAYG